MDTFEKTLDEQTVFRGKLLEVRCDSVQLPSGKQATREYIKHCGGVCVVAVYREKIAFVRQFRYPHRCEVLELPAGKLDKGEKPYDCGMRELREETGLTADRLISLGRMYPSPGYTDEIIYMYLAEGVRTGEQSLDDDEFLNVEYISLSDALTMIERGEIEDAKTQIALLRLAMYSERC